MSARAWLIAAAIAYNSWILGPLLNPALDAPLVSELAATGQPWAWVFRAGDLLAVLLLLPTVRKGHVFWWLFLLSTAVEATFPLHCVSQFTSDELLRSAACMTPSAWAHEVSSTSAGIGSIATVIFAWRAGHKGTLLGALHVIAVLVLTAAIVLQLPGTFELQRVSIMALSLWWIFAYERSDGFGPIKHQAVRSLHRHKKR